MPTTGSRLGSVNATAVLTQDVTGEILTYRAQTLKVGNTRRPRDRDARRLRKDGS